MQSSDQTVFGSFSLPTIHSAVYRFCRLYSIQTIFFVELIYSTDNNKKWRCNTASLFSESFTTENGAVIQPHSKFERVILGPPERATLVKNEKFTMGSEYLGELREKILNS